MSFTVTANNKLGPIKLERSTLREAFDLARGYQKKGFEAVSVTNVFTGERFSDQEIAENRLPAEPVAKL